MTTTELDLIGKTLVLFDTLAKMVGLLDDRLTLHVSRIDGDLTDLRDAVTRQDESLAELRDELHVLAKVVGRGQTRRLLAEVESAYATGDGEDDAA